MLMFLWYLPWNYSTFRTPDSSTINNWAYCVLWKEIRATILHYYSKYKRSGSSSRLVWLLKILKYRESQIWHFWKPKVWVSNKYLCSSRPTIGMVGLSRWYEGLTWLRTCFWAVANKGVLKITMCKMWNTCTLLDSHLVLPCILDNLDRFFHYSGRFWKR